MTIDFRAAHHWLRGYSDALRGGDENPQDAAYSGDYAKGFNTGLNARASFKANV